MIYRCLVILNLIEIKGLNLIELEVADAGQIFWLIVFIFFLNILDSIGGSDDLD